MKGSIRFGVGLLMVMGAVGGMDNVPGYLLEQTITAVIGLALMAWAVPALASNDYEA